MKKNESAPVLDEDLSLLLFKARDSFSSPLKKRKFRFGLDSACTVGAEAEVGKRRKSSNYGSARPVRLLMQSLQRAARADSASCHTSKTKGITRRGRSALYCFRACNAICEHPSVSTASFPSVSCR